MTNTNVRILHYLYVESPHEFAALRRAALSIDPDARCGQNPPQFYAYTLISEEELAFLKLQLSFSYFAFCELISHPL